MKKIFKKIRSGKTKETIIFFIDQYFYKRKNVSLKIIYACFFRKIFFTSKNNSKKKCIVFHYKKAIYLIISKSACTSIEMVLRSKVDKEEPKKQYFYNNFYNKKFYKTYFKKELLKNHAYKFTFVRNPFARAVSCFNDKVLGGFYTTPNNYFFLKYQAAINDNKEFKTFLKKIDQIPDALADHHFKSQYAIVFYQDQPLFDYAGKIEDFPESFEPMRKKFNLEKLGYHNVTSNIVKKKWQDFYDEETAALVYKRYQKDFTTWYPEAYRELVDYMKNK